MDDVLRAFTVRQFIGTTDDCPGNDSDDAVRDVLEANGVPIASPNTGVIEIDGVTLRILPLPPESACPNDENNNSIVVRLEFGHFSMLFTGDAEEKELRFLVENHPELLDVDVLKASHHGSRNGFTDEFLSVITPTHVVISAGVHRGFRHPHPEAVEAYERATNNRLFCTNRHGTIRLYGYEDGRIRVSLQNASTNSCAFDGT